ncbi:hypothetical protein I310_04438 [Cryptococcus deuterogattii CA1014]|nr:hypothetical protein I310_04438 [Cryptococcus deuterogattii CA1014]
MRPSCRIWTPLLVPLWLAGYPLAGPVRQAWTLLLLTTPLLIPPLIPLLSLPLPTSKSCELVHPASHWLAITPTTVPYIEGQLRSVEVTQATITQKTELELLSPAEGMREPYPNKNVRVLHADNRFSPFNVRLHLGGGLGASLWQPVTLGRVYLVVSFLAIPRSHHFPPDVAPVRRVSQINPPTRITSAPAMSGQGLPGFSSIAAGVDGPQPRYDQPPPQVYYPQPQQPPTARPPPPLTAQPYLSYPQTAMPANAPVYPPRRSSSPNSAYRPPQTASYPISPTEYQVQPGFYQPPGPPPLGTPTAIAGAKYRRSSYEEWRMAQQVGASAPLLPPRDHAAVAGGSSNDGIRRTWEL